MEELGGTRMGAWTRHRGRRHDPTSILPRSTLLPTALPLSVRLADRGCMCSVPPSILDYHSDSPTFALAFSPLSDTTASLKLAVGSFNDTRNDSNNITVISLDPSYLDLEDDYDDSLPEDSLEVFARQRSGSRVTMGSAFQPVARAPHPYPPSAIAFSPATLSGSLQGSHAGTAGEGTREMVASSSECLRLWDLVAGEASGSGFVGQGRQGGGSRLVQRAVLANVSLDPWTQGGLILMML
jgi:WD repeat-containing protein 68